MNRLKPLLFRLLAVGLPLALLVLLELALRAAGVAEDARRPFVPLPGQEDHRALNPTYVQRYFQGFTPGVAFTPFRARKDPEALRLFVLGGSTTAGFPYHFYHGFPEQLARQWEAASDRPVEVVNLGLTAVNSYTLWDLKDAVRAEAPDAVLIYAGHNEYYGAFGAGSTVQALGDRVWLKRLVLRLRRTVLFTLLERLLASPPPPETADRTLMSRVVRDAGIMPGSAAFEAGVTQFASNLGEVVETFRAAGIPVYLATLTSNLRDQPPLGDDPEALAAYARGEALLAAGDTTAARAAFLAAKEADGIRFRAPDTLNAVVRTLARAPGVTLVDVAAVFAAASPQGIEGAALFDDHLHPNARGYALMARTFLDALPEAAVPAAPDTSRLEAFERAFARLQIARLTAGYPFVKDVSPAQEQARFEAVLDETLRASTPDSLAARVVMQTLSPPEALLAAARDAAQRADTVSALLHYRALLHWQPFNTSLQRQAVGLALGSAAYDGLTAELARLARRRSRDDAYLTSALAAVYLRRGELPRAERLLDEAERRTPDAQEVLYNKARLLLLQGDTTGARAYFERYRGRR